MTIDIDNTYDVSISGNITALNGAVELDALQKDSQLVRVAGTWIATVSFQLTTDGTNWFPALAVNLSTGEVVSSTTVNGNFVILSAGCKSVRAIATLFTSGTVNIAVEGSTSSQYYGAISTNAASFLATSTQGPANTIANAWPVKITDGSDQAVVTATGDLTVSDGLSNGGVFGNLLMATANTAYEAKVGVSRLTNRKSLMITALDNMFWGYANTVTTANGMPLYKNQSVIFNIDADSSFQVWLVSATSSANARIAEST